MAQMALSSSSCTNPVKHHVFLSFRGEDTRNKFTAHLHCALRQKGIQAVIDNQLAKGEEISPLLITAIQQSKISVIVFSENYAFSTWCLDELVTIMECRESNGQLVWPIFFNVEPSHVRNMTESFGKALAGYEAASKYTAKLPKWKDALSKAGNLVGWHLAHGDESQLIQKVVEAALSKLNRTPLQVAKYPIGIEKRLKDLGTLIEIGTHDVRVVGIYGVGGIGKTTIAKALFNKFADEFEGSSFLANVRETSKQYCGLVQLQETLLFDMLGDSDLKVGNTHRGINIIRDRLCYKRVLLVLDDVDQLDQLEALAGGHNWFGLGSRVIITTRNKHFLTTYGANDAYEVKGLNHSTALELFSQNAFKSAIPGEGYYELSERVVYYANGLPLALVVSGSFLCGRSIFEWESAIKNLERKPHKQVYEILKISYDALQDYEKAIFLDIACFFVGEDKDYVIKILGSSNLCPTIGIGVLVDMSLITIESGKVQMHHMIQEVGWEVVCQESPEVGKRSRLWLAEDVFHVFSENMGTNAIEAIKLDLPKTKTLYLSARAFRKMKRIRLLIFRNVIVSTAVTYLPPMLKLIDWPGYQFPTLPLSSGPKQLVILNMPHSQIQQLGEGFKNFENLKVVNLSSSQFLTKIPDLSTAPNLESLYLNHCTNLVEIHESVGSLHGLSTLDLEFCSSLRILASSLQSENLGIMKLAGCYSLESFPNIAVEMKSLRKLTLSGTCIKELPSSIEHLVSLQVLSLAYCEELKNIPSSIYKLYQLKYLDLCCCSKLSKFPMESTFSNLFIQKDHSQFPFPKLECLELQNCNLSEVDFLSTPNGFYNLEQLNLSENKFVSLPSMERFSKLQNLYLNNCKYLQILSNFPPSVSCVYASGCESLLDIHGKNKVIAMLLSQKRFLEENDIQVILPGQDIPHWFSNQCEQDSIDFVVHSNESRRLAGMIICAVFVLDCNEVNLKLKHIYEDAPFLLQKASYRSSIVLMKSGHMWLHYVSAHKLFWNDAKHNEKCKVSFSAVEQPSGKFISKCGVHIIWYQDVTKLACSSQNSDIPATKTSPADCRSEDLEASRYPRKKARGLLRDSSE